MNMLKSIRYGLAAWTLTLVACQKFVAIAPPDQKVATAVVFQSDAAALSAVSGLYNKLRPTSLVLLNGGATFYGALSADELYNTAPNADVDPFTTNQVLPENTTGLSRLWSIPYAALYQANALLEGLAVGTVTDSLKRQFRGEALTLRALHYLYLVQFFGDVPLVLSTDYEVNERLPRAPIGQVYAQILADLREAVTLLKDTYPSPGRVRINRGAAAALLARADLYTGNWGEAESMATVVINQAQYSLVPGASLAAAFQASSPEAIWQLMRETANTADGETFLPSSSSVVPPYALQATLLSAFEAGDMRRLRWVDSTKVGSPQKIYYFPSKYKLRTLASGSAPTEYEVELRLAEQYLIRAEARVRQGNLTGGRADLNVIRTRAGLPATTAATQDELLSAIFQERRVELFCEGAHRWIDLKRSGQADAVLSALKGSNWQTTDQLYPIPLTEIRANPSLVQNPGY